MHRALFVIIGSLTLGVYCPAQSSLHKAGHPFLNAELLFPPEHWHNHASCIVECPNGDLLVCWYHGSGERTADDVLVLGARKAKGADYWSPPFLLADTPGYPDTNPAMFIDPQKRLWLLWPVILAHRWESALMKYRISSNYQKAGPPQWQTSEVLHVTPGTSYRTNVEAWLDELAVSQPATTTSETNAEWINRQRARVADELSCRLGWMTRVHPYLLDERRLIVPLYSDGFDFSLMAITDNWGQSWFTSAPVLGLANVQPSLVRKRNGILVALMRDNGSRHHRVQISESSDRGMTWSRASDSQLPNPGAGLEAIVLRNGLWVLVNNDLENGRYSLAVSLSDDEGESWKWTRHLERDTEPDIKAGPGSYHYPSIIQAKDGTIHVSYSFHLKRSLTKTDPSGRPASESIKHAHFNEAWIRQGE